MATDTPTEAEDDFIQDGLDISDELETVEERLLAREFDELEELAKKMREFCDHLEVYVNQRRAATGRPRSTTVEKLLERKNG